MFSEDCSFNGISSSRGDVYQRGIGGRDQKEIPSFSAIKAEGLVKVLWVFGIEVNNVERSSLKSLVRCGVEIVGRNIGVTTERLCGSKESPGFSINYELRRGVEVLYRM